MARRPIVPAELTRSAFSLVEARRAGLTKAQLQSSAWRRVASGMYAWVGLDDAPFVTLDAVSRRLPADAAFSGRTAAWLHGLDLPPCDPVEAVVPRGCGVSGRSDATVRRSELEPGDVVEVQGMRTTSALRTVTDLGRLLPVVDAVVALDMALQRQLIGLGDIDVFAAAHARWPGIARLRRVRALAEPAAESAMETRLRLLLVLAGLPRPAAQVPIHDNQGRFLGRPDLYYPDQRLGLEYDGRTHRDSLAQDDVRQNRLVAAGVRILRFTAADVYQHPESVVALVRSQLA